MRISFHARQFIQAALVVAGVLAGVLGLGWSRVLAFEIHRLDERLCMEARRLTGPLPPHEDIARLTADMALKLRLDTPSQLRMQALSPEGQVRVQSPGGDRGWLPDGLGWSAERARAGAPPRPTADPRGSCALASAAFDGAEWRVARVQAEAGSSTLAANLVAIKSEMRGALTDALGIVVPLALALTALSAWLLASLSLRPVNRLREAMRQVTPQALDQRLSDRGEDREFRDLITAYNTMLARLETSFHQASRFSADAAHELKTPLTILRGRLEQAIKQSDRLPIQGELSEMLDEVGRLSGITRKLLLLSQADAGKLDLQREAVDLSAMLDDMVADAQMLVQDQTLSSRIEPGLVIEGDALLLRQLFNNLVSNAVRHGLPAGWIRVQAGVRGKGVEVTVSNACAALNAVQRAHFFERFYRADPAHGRRVEGTGLGLSLAREVARAHGGELGLEPTADDVISLRVWLPLR
jgi:two-component system, OmpR family, heavy metal sensor histidine kinase CusS